MWLNGNSGIILLVRQNKTFQTSWRVAVRVLGYSFNPWYIFWGFCWTWTKRYLITSQTRVKRVSRIHHRTGGRRMVRWRMARPCIRLTRLALVCEVIRYRLVQVRQNLKKRLFGLAVRNRLSLSLPLSFSSSAYFRSFSMQTWCFSAFRSLQTPPMSPNQRPLKRRLRQCLISCSTPHTSASTVLRTTSFRLEALQRATWSASWAFVQICSAKPRPANWRLAVKTENNRRQAEVRHTCTAALALSSPAHSTPCMSQQAFSAVCKWLTLSQANRQY